MTMPAAPDTGPSQVPWPKSRRGSQQTASSGNGKGKVVDPSRRHMTTLDLIKLSISMAGAQIAWTVELGYGTPFLLSLGLSEHLTSLVWLAGPISGLIAQPVIGAISDASKSKYRRRYWIVLSTLVLIVSTFTLAYCREMAAFFVNMFGGGGGSRTKDVKNTAITFAVVSFYLLDFALNALQASLRNLVLDVTPPQQLNDANAWHSRMTNIGNIVGFGFGFLPLASMPILRLLGGDQFRKFCVVSIILLVITVWITCATQEEKSREDDLHVDRNTSKLRDVLRNIYTAVVNLPKPIRRVCYVQVFAFMGWFPFLFYATTYIGQVMAYELDREPDNDLATRTGEFALSIYSVVAVIAGALLPRLTARDERLLAHEGDEDEDAEFSRLRTTVREWRADAARKGEPLKLPFMPFFLRNIWTGALLLFAAITLSTFFITKVWQAIIAVSLVGICWAVACWIPFAIIMEFLKEREQEVPEEVTPRESSARRPSHTRTQSTPASRPGPVDERQPLLRRRRSFEEHHDLQNSTEAEAVAGGTILGIHNLAIVFPQFIVALVSSAIFHAVDADVDNDPNNHNTYYGKTGVAWVLRFGGICAIIGAAFARMVPPTKTEKQMRRRLAELKLLESEGSP